jgi:hypothetical protein
MATAGGHGKHEAKHSDLQEACKQAYKAARDRGESPPFVIDQIVLEGTNPFDGFRVIISKPGP